MWLMTTLSIRPQTPDISLRMRLTTLKRHGMLSLSKSKMQSRPMQTTSREISLRSLRMDWKRSSTSQNQRFVQFSRKDSIPLLTLSICHSMTHRTASVKFSSNRSVHSVRMLHAMPVLLIVIRMRIKRRWSILINSHSTSLEEFDPWSKTSTNRLPIWKKNSMRVLQGPNKISRRSLARSSNLQATNRIRLWTWHLDRLMSTF